MAFLARHLLATVLTLTAGGAAALAYGAPQPELLHGTAVTAAVVPAEAPAVDASFSAIAAEASGLPEEALGHSFYFSRAVYSGGGFRRSGWAVDYPEADHWIVQVLRRLTLVDVYQRDHPIRLDDPNLRRFPFLYAVEVGSMGLTPAEVQGLREYLLAGGFLMADDFWGTFEWRNFEQQMRRVLPEYEIVEIPMDHPIFATYYEIDRIIQVPNVGQGIAGGRTHEQDGVVPRCLGIFDEKGRLMVVINWNTDLGDAWEWAELAEYPLAYSTFAYQMAANFIVYAMTR